MTNFLFIFVAMILVLLNAFFVAAEFGMVKLRNTQVNAIKESHGLRGRVLANIHKSLDAYLSACQLGITLASLALGWIGEPAFSNLLTPLFEIFGITSPELTTAISVIIAFLIISFLHIVVGELMPKSLAIRQSEKISLWTAIPLYGFYWLMFPAIWVLNSCSNFLLKIAGLSDSHRSDACYSAEEIKLILSSSHSHGELTNEEIEMLEHTLDFTELKVTEVMRPYDEMVMINMNHPIKDSMKFIMEHQYSRYPVYNPDTQDIIGIIHIKDLFSTLFHKGEITHLEPLIRPVLKVSRRLPVLDLLRQFREESPHFAIVHGRSNASIGFVTLDNLLQVLIGRIKDEFNLTKDDWTKHPDGSITLRGDCSIYSVEQALDQDLILSNDEEDIDTIAGLIIHRFGRLPKQKETIEFKEFRAVIDKTQKTRIKQLTIYPHPSLS